MSWKAVQFVDLSLAESCSQFVGLYFASINKYQHGRLSPSLYFLPVQVIAIIKAKILFIATETLRRARRQSLIFRSVTLTLSDRSEKRAPIRHGESSFESNASIGLGMLN